MSVKRTPAEWLALKHPGVVIRDPDGWREDGRSMDEPITENEFTWRLVGSTLSGSRVPREGRKGMKT